MKYIISDAQYFGYKGSSFVKVESIGRVKPFYFATAIRGEKNMYYKSPSRRYITVKGKKHFRAVQKIHYRLLPREVKRLMGIWRAAYKQLEGGE